DRGEHLGVDAGVVVGCESPDRGVMQAAHSDKPMRAGRQCARGTPSKMLCRMSAALVSLFLVSDEAGAGAVRDGGADAVPQEASEASGAPPGGFSPVFLQVLINTGVANVTTSFLWFALTFWVYIETQSVLATGIIG